MGNAHPIWYSKMAEKAGQNQLSRQYVIEALKREPNNPKMKQRAVALGISK